MSTHTPNLWVILSQTSHVIRAHTLHFLALSALFIFPISIWSIIYPFLLQPNSVNSDYDRYLFIFTADPQTYPAGKSQLLFSILNALLLLIFSFCATTSITFTTFQVFHGRPVSFISSLKSILVSFFPLLATRLLIQIILGLVIFAFVILMLLSYNALVLLGFVVDYDSEYLLVFVILLSALLLVPLVYLQVEWCLSTAVVVVESEWGLVPLKRSSYLVKGLRRIALSLMIFVGTLVGLSWFWYSNLLDGIRRGQISWWFFLLQMAVYAGFLTILSLYSFVANTILFVYCKDFHGELAFEVDEKLGLEYVRLPSDDGVDSSVVNIV
ncbi:hypothetical protein CDL12_25187 [Handroanthus impetiginosus]|uniref:Transmembrane protein n=1 Tax=Handroanthus impetiginosus TaxID=429701 RepID=A0A2G9GAI1_9LAMI|nr:hypothetical protein CDL12_25187 [Handroanthus impetiginosus]